MWSRSIALSGIDSNQCGTIVIVCCAIGGNVLFQVADCVASITAAATANGNGIGGGGVYFTNNRHAERLYACASTQSASVDCERLKIAVNFETNKNKIEKWIKIKVKRRDAIRSEDFVNVETTSGQTFLAFYFFGLIRFRSRLRLRACVYGSAQRRACDLFVLSF